ncbi:MAG: ATP-NAD kinase family protein, partial [Methanomicrobiaceae archaeon]|nr:ATP-NAD kinase family protein [Methanomicrobiaceae archaeon]
LEGAGPFLYEVVYTPHSVETTAEDTRSACRAFLEYGVSSIVFCGGDGTARDIFSVSGRSVPLIGVPAGVKMYSAVFALNPEAAAALIHHRDAPPMDAEVVDVDEEAYRKGELKIKIFGYAPVPAFKDTRQQSKWVSDAGSEEDARAAIAEFITEIVRDDTLYILGAGTTTAAIAERLGAEKTLLGVDAFTGGRIIARDCDERTLLSLLSEYPRAKVVISPIGAQGFVLGRGNQQISPDVMRRVRIKNLIVVATPQKLAQTPVLYVDTGDAELDRSFGESIAVISGYRMAQRHRLLHR